MKIITLFLSALLFMFSCNNKLANTNEDSNTTTNENTETVFDSFDNGFYHMQGKINKQYPITMNINVEEDIIEGTMYYDKAGKYIKLKGNIDAKGNVTIKGTAPNNKITDIFEGIYSNGTFSGTWSSEVSDKTFNFLLTKTDKHYVLCDSIAYQYKDSVLIGDEYGYFTASLDAKFPIAYPDPKADELIDEDIKMLLGIGKNEETDKIEENLKAEGKEWKENTSDIDEDEPFAMMYSYENERSITVTMDSYGILTILEYVFGFEGGAHGYTTLEYYSYDLMTGKKYTYEDIFTISKDDLLKAVIIKGLADFCEDFYEEPIENIVFSLEDIGFPDAFYVNEKGIGFFYGQYSIAPYVYGYQDFIVEYKDLLMYLTEDFKKKIKL